MPFREVDIQYEFPENDKHKRRVVRRHQKAGRTWLSTAIVNGKTRLRFGRFERYSEEVQEEIVERMPRSDKGKPRGAILNPRVEYPGQIRRGRPEWDR